MSEIEKQMAQEVAEEAKGLNKEALIYARGVIDGLKARTEDKAGEE